VLAQFLPDGRQRLQVHGALSERVGDMEDRKTEGMRKGDLDFIELLEEGLDDVLQREDGTQISLEHFQELSGLKHDRCKWQPHGLSTRQKVAKVRNRQYWEVGFPRRMERDLENVRQEARDEARGAELATKLIDDLARQ
jgi:hypothetical protein